MKKFRILANLYIKWGGKIEISILQKEDGLVTSRNVAAVACILK